MKKELGYDRDGVKLTMRTKNFWSYGVSGLGLVLVPQMIAKMSYFYTEELGMTALAAGNAILAAKFVDAGTDLVMGYLVDRTKTRWGKARPYILLSSILLIPAMILLFAVPSSLSGTGQFLYAVLTNVFASAVVATIINTPLQCLLYYRTRSQVERTKMNIPRTFTSILLSFALNILFIPMKNAFGGTQKGWIIASIIFGAIGALSLLICFFSTPEVTDEGEDSEAEDTKVSFLEGLKALLTNKYWLIIAISRLLVEVTVALGSVVSLYYAKWLLGNEELASVVSLVTLPTMVIGMIILGQLVKRFGARNVSRYALILGMVGAVVRIASPLSIAMYTAGTVIASFATVPFNMLDNVMLSDVADFEEYRSGKRMVGMVNAASAFGIKGGSGITSGLVGGILFLCHYQEKATSQPASAINAISFLSNILPLILFILLFILLTNYDIEKKFPNFKKELAEKKMAAKAEESA